VPDTPPPLTVPAGEGAIVDVRPHARLPRWLAVAQAVLVCGIPTQVLLAGVVWFGFGIAPLKEDGLSLEFFAIVSLLDTALIALLIRAFLSMSGETSAQVFLGWRPVRREVWRGLALVPVVFVAVTAGVLFLRAAFPALHNVDVSPLEGFMRTPLEAGIFLVVVVLAGGVREELQRAFILHRFKHYLGGVRVGLVVFSLTFAVLHLDQGFDAAIAIGTLGFVWGVLYIRRESVVTPLVNHAGFNAAQVVQVLVARSLGLPV
jgi:membrane protease YdiL (CAAX protease family)